MDVYLRESVGIRPCQHPPSRERRHERPITRHYVRWYKEQTIADEPVHVAHTKGGVLLVSYPQQGTNFHVEAKSDEEIAEALLMILSYRAPAKDPKDP